MFLYHSRGKTIYRIATESIGKIKESPESTCLIDLPLLTTYCHEKQSRKCLEIRTRTRDWEHALWCHGIENPCKNSLIKRIHYKKCTAVYMYMTYSNLISVIKKVSSDFWKRCEPGKTETLRGMFPMHNQTIELRVFKTILSQKASSRI